MRTVSIPREQIFQGPLVLVNRAHPLHEKERSALTSVDPHHPDILLESRARQLLSACIQKAGGQREIVPEPAGTAADLGRLHGGAWGDIYPPVCGPSRMQ